METAFVGKEVDVAERKLQIELPGFAFTLRLNEIPAVWDVVKSWDVALDFVCGPVHVKVS